MPQMSGSQVRVVDPVLTEVARGYSNPAFVGSGLFPYMPLNYFQFNLGVTQTGIEKSGR